MVVQIVLQIDHQLVVVPIDYLGRITILFCFILISKQKGVLVVVVGMTMVIVLT